mmetsp:Transcript_25450/g.59377  ORF Transcript_25450/g.59377 Transcript_25450/m.59377 type:complete len:217 (-) Transcript_25450:558-1208(-)
MGPMGVHALRYVRGGHVRGSQQPNQPRARALLRDEQGGHRALVCSADRGHLHLALGAPSRERLDWAGPRRSTQEHRRQGRCQGPAPQPVRPPLSGHDHPTAGGRCGRRGVSGLADRRDRRPVCMQLRVPARLSRRGAEPRAVPRQLQRRVLVGARQLPAPDRRARGARRARGDVRRGRVRLQVPLPKGREAGGRLEGGGRRRLGLRHELDHGGGRG